MNAGNFRSLCAAVLLLACMCAGLGGWGTYYFGLKSAKEKEERSALKEQQWNEELSSLERTNEELRSRAKSFEPPASQLPQQAPIPPQPSSAARVPKPQTGRSLSDKQHQEIVDALRKHAGKSITICSVESDPEGFAFAGTLKRLFEEAGWHVEGVKQVSYTKPRVGLNLATGSFPSPEGLVATYLAFTAAGFNVSQQLDAKLTGGQSELIVGPAQ